MISKLISALLSVAMLAASSVSYAASDTASIKTAMMTPALINPVTGQPFPGPVKICTDAKFACIPGVDTCCDGSACPSDKVCP